MIAKMQSAQNWKPVHVNGCSSNTIFFYVSQLQAQMCWYMYANPQSSYPSGQSLTFKFIYNRANFKGRKNIFFNWSQHRSVEMGVFSVMFTTWISWDRCSWHRSKWVYFLSSCSWHGSIETGVFSVFIPSFSWISMFLFLYQVVVFLFLFIFFCNYVCFYCCNKRLNYFFNFALKKPPCLVCHFVFTDSIKLN